MESNVICFGCRQHDSAMDLVKGEHNHVDERERLQAQAESKRTS